tara:strand:- start:120 stop:524 length:405 start_codon:yes stop_codon:yes gene_type:complete
MSLEEFLAQDTKLRFDIYTNGSTGEKSAYLSYSSGTSDPEEHYVSPEIGMFPKVPAVFCEDMQSLERRFEDAKIHNYFLVCMKDANYILATKVRCRVGFLVADGGGAKVYHTTEYPPNFDANGYAFSLMDPGGL